MRSLAGWIERQQKVGGWAALYVAVAFVAAMPYFLLFVKYPERGGSRGEGLHARGATTAACR